MSAAHGKLFGSITWGNCEWISHLARGLFWVKSVLSTAVPHDVTNR